MTRSRLVTASVAAVTLLAAFAGGCSSSKSTSAASPSATQATSAAASATASTSAPASASATATGSGAAVGAAIVAGAPIGKFGTILVDGKGRTLYLFEADTGSKSTCEGACATAWPPLITTGSPTAANGADQSLIGTTTRSDGSTQVLYNGHPLYTYSGDKAQGDTNGEDSNAFGANWYVVSVKGAKVEPD